ncbi:MAG: hypothetical protein ACSHYC_22095 [Alphaproteobacteria bacterium]
MTKTYILTIFLLAIFTSSAFSEPRGRITHPLPNEPIIDLRIDHCEATKGYGSYWYHTNSGLIFALSDLCIDEESGLIESFESRSGYTLVEKSKNGRVLEIIDSSEAQVSRTNMRYYNFSCSSIDESSFLHGMLVDKKNYPNAYGGPNVQGYTIPPISNLPTKRTAEHAELGLQFFSQAQISQKTTSEMPDIASLLGELSITENGGVFSITEGAGISVGEASGVIEFELNATGEVELSGKITAKNQRLAGHAEGEWITMKAEIPFMRGHLLGSKGNELRAFGIARGSFVDTSGQTHQFRALASLDTCFSADNR